MTARGRANSPSAWNRTASYGRARPTALAIGPARRLPAVRDRLATPTGDWRRHRSDKVFGWWNHNHHNPPRPKSPTPKPDLSSTEALISHLKLEIEKLRRQLYGGRSKRKARLLDQMELQLDELEAAASEDVSISIAILGVVLIVVIVSVRVLVTAKRVHIGLIENNTKQVVVYPRRIA
jgi:hypothetical protein